jgi:hypothetical protein
MCGRVTMEPFAGDMRDGAAVERDKSAPSRQRVYLALLRERGVSYLFAPLRDGELDLGVALEKLGERYVTAFSVRRRRSAKSAAVRETCSYSPDA